MTLQAENVQVAGFEQARVWGTVRRMAGYATLCLDRLVLEHEGSLLVRMARVANRVPRCRRAQLLANEPAMGVVTIRALNEAFFHAMVKRHIELWLHFLMAGIAEIRLRFDQEELIVHSAVGRMATQAAQVALAVRRPGKVHMVFA
jgi:hypothetical protein